MKQTILTTILIATMSTFTIAANVSTEFLDRLAQIESGRDDFAVNESENAHGRYQIRAAYLADANEALGTSYTLADCHDPRIAEAVVRAYLLRYGTAFEKRVGRTATPVDLARIHNGGPRGPEKAATADYGTAFLDLMEVGE